MARVLPYNLFMLVFLGCLITSCSTPGEGMSKAFQSRKAHQDTIKVDYGRKAAKNDIRSENISSPANPEILPSWMLDFNARGNDFFVLGISDPLMDSAQAKELAYFRALAMAALLNGSKVNNVSEAYYRDLTQNRLITTQFNSLSRINASIALGSETIAVANESYSAAGEYIVNLNYRPASIQSQDSMLVLAEVYYSETPLTVGDRIYIYFKISAFLKSPSKKEKEIFVWESHLDNGRLEFVSTFNGSKIEFPVRYRYYSSAAANVCDSAPDPDLYQHEDMGYGLWNAYAIAILRNIDLLEKEFADIKAMTDNYGGQAELLTREISSNKSAFRLLSACTMNNRFYLRMRQK